MKKEIGSLFLETEVLNLHKTLFRYYLEPASPLKSISTVSSQQQLPITNGITKISHQQQTDNSLAVLKSIQLTPPAANNRHHHNRTHHVPQPNGHVNGFSAPSDTNNNFFNTQTNLNGASNGQVSSQNGSSKSDNSEFVADFSKVNIYNSNNSLNSTGSGGQVNGTLTNGTATSSDLNANFADFENNKIYNAAGK